MGTTTEAKGENPLAHLDGSVEVTINETDEQRKAREERGEARKQQFADEQAARDEAAAKAVADSETTAKQVTETGVPAVQPASGIAEEAPPGTTHAATPRTSNTITEGKRSKSVTTDDN